MIYVSEISKREHFNLIFLNLPGISTTHIFSREVLTFHCHFQMHVLTNKMLALNFCQVLQNLRNTINLASTEHLIYYFKLFFNFVVVYYFYRLNIIEFNYILLFTNLFPLVDLFLHHSNKLFL